MWSKRSGLSRPACDTRGPWPISSTGHPQAIWTLPPPIRTSSSRASLQACAALGITRLSARCYHCGIIPVDSGMVHGLAPCLGITLPAGAVAHEQLRKLLESCATAHAGSYRDLAFRLGYGINIPTGCVPTWFLHLVLIYFKRL